MLDGRNEPVVVLEETLKGDVGPDDDPLDDDVGSCSVEEEVGDDDVLAEDSESELVERMTMGDERELLLDIVLAPVDADDSALKLSESVEDAGDTSIEEEGAAELLDTIIGVLSSVGDEAVRPSLDVLDPSFAIPVDEDAVLLATAETLVTSGDDAPGLSDRLLWPTKVKRLAEGVASGSTELEVLLSGNATTRLLAEIAPSGADRLPVIRRKSTHRP